MNFDLAWQMVLLAENCGSIRLDLIRQAFRYDTFCLRLTTTVTTSSKSSCSQFSCCGNSLQDKDLQARGKGEDRGAILLNGSSIALLDLQHESDRSHTERVRDPLEALTSAAPGQLA
jgi:hypothetical protein